MIKVTAETHGERRKIIQRIAKDYTNNLGQIRLTSAFANHPEYQKQLAELGLDGPIKLNAYVLHMRRKDLLPPSGYSGRSRPPKVKIGGRPSGSRGKHLPEEHYQTAFKLIRDYRHGSKVDWRRAFIEHPDIAKLLDYPSNKCSSFLNRARNRFEREGRPAQTLPDAPPPAVVAPPPDPLPFNYCPKCGTNLLMFITAFRVANKHSHRNGGRE